MSLIVIVANF